MNEREQWGELLIRFGELTDRTVTPDEAGSCTFRFGETEDLGHFEFLQSSATVVLWATLGILPPDRLAPMRLVRLLQMQDLGQEASGFTLGTESGTGRVVVAARRALIEFADGTDLASWVDRLTTVVRDVRQSLVDDFPVEEDDFEPDDVALDDEDGNPEDSEEG